MTDIHPPQLVAAATEALALADGRHFTWTPAEVTAEYRRKANRVLDALSGVPGTAEATLGAVERLLATRAGFNRGARFTDPAEAYAAGRDDLLEALRTVLTDHAGEEVASDAA